MDNSISLDDIKSNNVNYCLYCGRFIYPSIDSGCEGFTADGVTTQKICVFCNAERENEPIIKYADNGEQCNNKADWVISSNDPYQDTYSCTEHLSSMVFEDTEIIRKAVGEEEKQQCCYMKEIKNSER